jgi:hypothetical protein
MGNGKGVHTEVWWGSMRERDHFEDLVLNWRIILKCLFKKSARGVDWVDLAQGRKRWRVVVEAAISLGFSKTRGVS